MILEAIPLDNLQCEFSSYFDITDILEIDYICIEMVGLHQLYRTL